MALNNPNAFSYSSRGQKSEIRFTRLKKGFLCGSDGKESTCNAGDLDSIPGLERSPGEGNGNPLQYSCLGNPIDREGGSMGSQKSQTQLERLNNNDL